MLTKIVVFVCILIIGCDHSEARRRKKRPQEPAFVKCSPNWEKIGCYKDNSRKVLKTFALTARDEKSSKYAGHGMIWKRWKEFLHSFTCKCAEQALLNEHMYFGLQNWGECWTGDWSSRYDKLGPELKCYQYDWTSCNDSDNNECVGAPDVNYVYSLNGMTAPPPTVATTQPSTAATTTEQVTEPATEAPSSTEPATEAPTSTEPATEASPTTEAATEAPTSTEPATEAPTSTEPATEASPTTEAATEAPTSTEPATEASTKTEPATETSGNTTGSAIAANETKEEEEQEEQGGNTVEPDQEEEEEIPTTTVPPPDSPGKEETENLTSANVEFKCPRTIDLAIAVDVAVGFEYLDLDTLKQFLVRLVDHFNIAASASHFALMQFNTSTRIEYDFLDSTYYNPIALKSSFDVIKYTRGASLINKALDDARTKLFSSSGGARDHNIVPHVLLVISDGRTFQGPKMLIAPAKALKANHVKVVSLGLGPTLHEAALDIMSDGKYLAYKNLENFASNIDHIANELTKLYICE